jgi:ABC-type uncharacterized transport system auxiliary subunit
VSRHFAMITRWLGSAALLAGLAGCALPAAPLDHHYRLTADAVEARFDSPILPGTLRVKRPRADAFTDGTSLLYRDAGSPTEIHRDPYRYWIDAPSLMIRDGLIHVLREARVAGQVITPELRTHADYTLASRLLELERLRDGAESEAGVEIELSLVRERDDALIFQAVYAETEPVDGREPSRTVEAFDRALERILTRFLTDLADARDARPLEFASWHR